jgi:hypothetical protein
MKDGVEAMVPDYTQGKFSNACITAAKNKKVTPNTGEVPHVSCGYVWRHNKQAVKLVPMASEITYSTQDISRISSLPWHSNNRYLITNDGRIFDAQTSTWIAGSLVTPYGKGRSPYQTHYLRKNSGSHNKTTFRTSRIVAETYNIKGAVIAHLDNNVLNCAVPNLVGGVHRTNTVGVTAYQLEWREVEIVKYPSTKALSETLGIPVAVTYDNMSWNKGNANVTEFSSDVRPRLTEGGYVIRGLSKN